MHNSTCHTIPPAGREGSNHVRIESRHLIAPAIRTCTGCCSCSCSSSVSKQSFKMASTLSSLNINLKYSTRYPSSCIMWLFTVNCTQKRILNNHLKSLKICSEWWRYILLLLATHQKTDFQEYRVHYATFYAGEPCWPKYPLTPCIRIHCQSKPIHVHS